MYNNLIVNVTLNKNENIINIAYHVYFNTLFTKGSSIDGLNIHLEKVNSYHNIINMNKNDIQEKLSKFGCTDKEIEKFINIAEFKTVNKNDMKFSISDYQYIDANITLDEILNNKDSKLTDIQKKLLKNKFKKEITYDEYIKLSESEKQIYQKGPYDYICIRNTINFLNEFITKHQAYVSHIDLDCELITFSKSPHSFVIIKTKETNDNYFININKFYFRNLGGSCFWKTYV